MFLHYIEMLCTSQYRKQLLHISLLLFPSTVCVDGSNSPNTFFFRFIRRCRQSNLFTQKGHSVLRELFLLDSYKDRRQLCPSTNVRISKRNCVRQFLVDVHQTLIKCHKRFQNKQERKWEEIDN